MSLCDEIAEQRKQLEMSFHNKREKDRNELDQEAFLRKYGNKRFYATAGRSSAYITEWLRDKCPGAVALDYCCGLGHSSIEIAKLGAFAHGIDISEEEVETARRAADQEGLGSRTKFWVMDAENMQFDNDMFDVIVCKGVLHHLDVSKAYPELARVLKPGGRILCQEALGYNPLIRLYRKATPHLRTAWETEHILKLKELALARRYFDQINVRYFHLFSILAIPLMKTPVFKAALTAFECLDDLILRIPFVQLLAWQMVFEMSGPRK
ncbi:MAG: class I SAM-dependent methyltransferase [Syntrophobacteraceae bacterium]|nr:class I SAM-dependent methyltransferase [Syntrophobacteraceae bacterium]MDR3561371.1 class I SAM-dependent methyltransferase [Negativicutes bacterium]